MRRAETNHNSDSQQFLWVAVAVQSLQSVLCFCMTLCDARLGSARYDFIFISQWWFFCIEDIIYRNYMRWRMTVTQTGRARQSMSWCDVVTVTDRQQLSLAPPPPHQQQQQQQQSPHFLILSPSNFSLIRLARQEHRQTTATLNNQQQTGTETGMEFEIFSMWSMAAGDTIPPGCRQEFNKSPGPCRHLFREFALK